MNAAVTSLDDEVAVTGCLIGIGRGLVAIGRSLLAIGRGLVMIRKGLIAIGERLSVLGHPCDWNDPLLQSLDPPVCGIRRAKGLIIYIGHDGTSGFGGT